MEGRAHEQVANMVRTTQLEKDLAESTGSGRWIDIFKGVDLRRTEITVCVWVLQNFSGTYRWLVLGSLCQEPCSLEIRPMSFSKLVSVNKLPMTSDGVLRLFSLERIFSTCSCFITLVGERSTLRDSCTVPSTSSLSVWQRYMVFKGPPRQSGSRLACRWFVRSLSLGFEAHHTGLHDWVYWLPWSHLLCHHQ